jgi:glycosyltransferase involved in cell wall biosynthesis
LFEEALRSVLTQEPGPEEVIVGDDSGDAATKEVVQEYRAKGAPIRYRRNDPSLGQAKNVHSLLQQAVGKYTVLLHDDDQLVEGALVRLSGCLEDNPGLAGAFGKQQVIGPEGKVRKDKTRELNRAFDRTPEYEGRQESSLRSAVTQQFPNDGYMVQTALAQQVGYDHSEMGDACDFAFGVELAQAAEGDFYYVDTFTSQYRLSKQSIGRGQGSPDAAYRSYKYVLESLPRDLRETPEISQWLRNRAPISILQAAREGNPRTGLKWFFGPYHRHRILTAGGARRLYHLLSSLVTS